ncbi:MAG TPA: hypothetical protein VIK77_05535 [Tissierellaceae bacterium]
MARTPGKLIEMGFEEYIEEHLLKSGYISGNAEDCSKEFALDTNEMEN